MENKQSHSASYRAAGVDIEAGYKAVELMKQHVARTMIQMCIRDSGQGWHQRVWAYRENGFAHCGGADVYKRQF